MDFFFDIPQKILAAFGSSILRMHSRECIPAIMYFQECILLKIVRLVKY